MQKNLYDKITYLKGVGPKRAETLNEVNIFTIWDLLNYFPRRYLDRTCIKKVNQLKIGETATVVGIVDNFGLVKNRNMKGSRFRLIISDDTGYLSLVWFRGASYYQNAFTIGEMIAVFGKIDYYHNEIQIAHPEFDRIDDGDDNRLMHTGAIIPLYPATEELRKIWLDSRGFRRLIQPLLPVTAGINDTLPINILQNCGLIPLSKAYEQIHFPSSVETLKSAQERLKFDEFFFLGLMMAYLKRKIKVQPNGIEFGRVGEKTKELVARLTFELTEPQKKVLREIRQDMKSPHAMNRLLQGDVGSGKTIVALLAILIAVENGYQAAFMAPTEILAEQHFTVLREYLDGMNVSVVLLKGGQKKAERECALAAVESHQADIIVGTHALFQEKATFAKLGLIIIDEQHRFGVMQRAEIRQKAVDSGVNPDVLVMTATPIPRTLAMTVYGDLDVSVIDELPSGRKPVKTVARSENARPKINEFIRREIRSGRQGYIVFPLIEQSEKSDLKAATEACEHMSEEVFPEFRIGLLHGRMKSAEKERVMHDFKNRALDLLVSTTVVEVGVNITNATFMIIEHAERFGLTQLHQLRGRVGRGAVQSYCILMVNERAMTDESRRRIEAMCRTSDGFVIAEEDLDIRGPGEFFGTRQSGLPELKLAHIIYARPILEKARKEAFRLIQEDPQLRAPEHAAIRKKFIEEYQTKYGLGQIG